MRYPIGHYSRSRGAWLGIAVGLLGLAGLYAISRHNFLLFHCLTEGFSIAVALAVFAVFWNTRQFVENGAYLVIGLVCPFACALDVIYMLAYQGMSVFPGADGNTALQAKTAAEWLVSLSCAAALLLLRSKIDPARAVCIYSVLFAVALGTIFYWPVFPGCFVPGVGITAFARIGLGISCAAYLGGLVLLFVWRREFDGYVLKLFAATLTALFTEDLAAAFATDLSGPARTVAHLCQVIAFCFIYRAIVEVGLTRPYGLLFRSQKQSAEELQNILDRVPAWIFYKDKENRFLRVNRAFAESMGMPREQLEGKSVFDLYPRQQAEAYWKDDHEVIASGKPKTNIIEPVRIKNEERWLQTDKIPYRDAQGEIVGILAFAVEITERKRAEEAIRASERRYRLLVETIPQLAWQTTPDGLEIECNRRWHEYTGQGPEQVRAHGWLAAVHPDDLFATAEKSLRAVNNREPFEVEYRLRRASDGAYRWHLSRTLPLLSEDGQVTSWIGSATDIEDLKQAQEMLRRAHEEQREKHRVELAHAARLGMMGEMAASLAHELNQPLHAVNNYARGCIRRVLKTPQTDEELVAALKQIGEEANRAAEIVRRVRRFVEKRDPLFSDVLVNGMVKDVISLIEPELEQHHVRVVLELKEDLPPILGDSIQIGQVLMNLIRNGLEAMDETPEESRVLSIATRRYDENAVEVLVRDCGPGIRAEEPEKLFQPFFTTKPVGMGMGLAISRSIIQAHGGRLWVPANQAAGCTFHFTLPIGKQGLADE